MRATLTETALTMRVLLPVLAVLLSGCQCTPPADCATSCAGCCDATGACQPGTTSAACGTGASACVACTGTQSCQTHACTDPAPTGFQLIDLDATAVDATVIAMAVDAAQERIGVAYFSNLGTQTMPGTPDYALQYVEWRQGVRAAPQRVKVVQRVVGLSLAFEPSTGEPLVAYLGGGADTSLFWFQSDAVLSRRTGGTTWTELVVATRGDQVSCPAALSDCGFLVGLWPSVVFDSTGKLYFVYRDAHQAQFATQDWSVSDVELWEGAVPPTVPTCVAAGTGGGGHNQLALGAGDQPALVYDQMADAADNGGANLYFQRRTAAGTWTAPASLLGVTSTQTGASLAWDSQAGYGIATLDRATNILSFLSSQDGTSWAAPEDVFGSGTGGWYPSLAFDPLAHEPAIAFAFCSPAGNGTETSCRASQDELRVSQRGGGVWHETLVDAAGGVFPKLGFFASGKRFVVYRAPPAVDGAGVPVTGVGQLKLAVER